MIFYYLHHREIASPKKGALLLKITKYVWENCFSWPTFSTPPDQNVLKSFCSHKLSWKVYIFRCRCEDYSGFCYGGEIRDKLEQLPHGVSYFWASRNKISFAINTDRPFSRSRRSPSSWVKLFPSDEFRRVIYGSLAGTVWESRSAARRRRRKKKESKSCMALKGSSRSARFHFFLTLVFSNPVDLSSASDKTDDRRRESYCHVRTTLHVNLKIVLHP